jgi:hypothetical protein
MYKVVLLFKIISEDTRENKPFFLNNILKLQYRNLFLLQNRQEGIRKISLLHRYKIHDNLAAVLNKLYACQKRNTWSYIEKSVVFNPA